LFYVCGIDLITVLEALAGWQQAPENWSVYLGVQEEIIFFKVKFRTIYE